MSRMTTLQKKSAKTARRANKRTTKAVSPVAADARDTAVRYADATRDWAAPKVESAVDWAAPKVGTAKDWAAPKVEPAVDKVKSDLLPAVAGAVATALAASEPARSEAATRGSAALAALKGEVAPPKKSKHRVRKVFLLATVLGAAYAGWKAWMARSNDPVDAWTTPATPAVPAAAPVGNVTAVSSNAPITDDPAGASPDEALADAAEEDKVDLTTTEPVSTTRAKKVSDAAAKGSKTPKGPSTS